MNQYYSGPRSTGLSQDDLNRALNHVQDRRAFFFIGFVIAGVALVFPHPPSAAAPLFEKLTNLHFLGCMALEGFGFAIAKRACDTGEHVEEHGLESDPVIVRQAKRDQVRAERRASYLRKAL